MQINKCKSQPQPWYFGVCNVCMVHWNWWLLGALMCCVRSTNLCVDHATNPHLDWAATIWHSSLWHVLNGNSCTPNWRSLRRMDIACVHAWSSYDEKTLEPILRSSTLHSMPYVIHRCSSILKKCCWWADNWCSRCVYRIRVNIYNLWHMWDMPVQRVCNNTHRWALCGGSR